MKRGLKFLEPKEETGPLFESELYCLARAYNNANRNQLMRTTQAWANETEDNLRAYLGQYPQSAKAMAEDVLKVTGIQIEHLCPVKRQRAR
jgi:hypothetical protein